jgi:hypothetical protein
MTMYAESALIVLAAVTLVQAAMLWRVTRKLEGAARINARLSHFAEALALLTDTTEAGLANLAAEFEHGRRRTTGGSRRATSRRIVTAARRGRAIEDIAAAEAMSESEIRLHLEMADAANGERDGSLRI